VQVIISGRPDVTLPGGKAAGELVQELEKLCGVPGRLYRRGEVIWYARGSSALIGGGVFIFQSECMITRF
jgi:hypothetical protein